METVEKKRKILFVAPFAHCDGHHCYEACIETEALSTAGMEVVLLTFNGLIDESVRPKIVMKTVLGINHRPIIDRMNSRDLTKWPSMLVAALLTLIVALQIYGKEKFDVIHLRDADPFPFLPRLVGLFAKNARWVVSLLSTLERVPYAGPLSRFPPWCTVYKISLMNGNRYLNVCQNPHVKDYYSKEFLGGILYGTVYQLPPMVSSLNYTHAQMSQADAKVHLGLPADKTIFLSFGSVHNGKDPETIFSALESFQNVICLHAGKTTSNMISSFDLLKRRYNGNVMYNDQYIPETEKPYYFAASSAIILSYTKNFKATSSMLWEACRFKVPIIASESVQLGGIVRSFGLGLTFDSQNPSSLREALASFMTLGNNTIREMKNNCEKFCSYYSDEKWTAKCKELYQELQEIKPLYRNEKSPGHIYNEARCGPA